MDELTGDVDRYKDFFAALEKTSPVPIAFENIEGGSHGYYHLEDKRIAINEGMSELQTLKTAIHEIAHAKLHDIDSTHQRTSSPALTAAPAKSKRKASPIPSANITGLTRRTTLSAMLPGGAAGGSCPS